MPLPAVCDDSQLPLPLLSSSSLPFPLLLPPPTAEPKPTDLVPSASEPPGSFPEHRNVNPFGIGGRQRETEEDEQEEELEPTRVRKIERQKYQHGSHLSFLLTGLSTEGWCGYCDHRTVGSSGSSHYHPACTGLGHITHPHTQHIFSYCS